LIIFFIQSFWIIIQQTRMSPFYRSTSLQFICACCSTLSKIDIENRQKRAHIIHCQRCPFKPFICSTCRRRKGKKDLTGTCVWCQTTGTIHSMHSLSCVEMSATKTDSWNYLKKQTASLTKLPYLKRVILTNWCKFMELEQFVSCTFFTFSFYVKELKENFMHTWLNSQLSQNVTSRDFSALFFETKISKRFLHILKTITFARKLVSNLFQVQSNQRLFSQRMRRLVLHRLLSSVADFFW